jgi:hypothetical protein
MTIADWITLWTWTAGAGIAAFTIMAAWVTVAGVRDIRSLYAALDRSHARRRPGRRKRA